MRSESFLINYSTDGAHPLPPQRVIKIKTKTDAPEKKDSPYPVAPVQSHIVPGFSPMFRLKYEPGAEIYRKTSGHGFVTARSNLRGVYVDRKLTGKNASPAEIAEHITDNLIFLGMSNMHTAGYNVDSQRRVESLVSGAMEVIVDEKVDIGDKVMLKVLTPEQHESLVHTGTQLQKTNPYGVRVVKKSAHVTQKSASDNFRKIMGRLDKNLLSDPVRCADALRESIKLSMRGVGNGAGGGVNGSKSGNSGVTETEIGARLKDKLGFEPTMHQLKQVIRVLSFLNDTMINVKCMEDMMKVTINPPKNQDVDQVRERLVEKFIDTTANIVRTASMYKDDTDSVTVGTVIRSNNVGGNLAHVHVDNT